MCDHFEQRLDIPRHMVVRETNAHAAALARRARPVSMQLVATQVMPAFMWTEVSAR
jgi:hypothetical protein